MSVRHVIPISGKDSLCTALLQTAKEPGLEYEFLFNDTGCELPETYAWLDEVEQATGWKIERCGKSLENVIREQNMLPSIRRRFCTKYGKIYPMQDRYKLLKSNVHVYYGLRADENRVGISAPSWMAPEYPLVEMGIGLRAVWSILEVKGLLPPSFFWPSLFYAVAERLGEDPENWLDLLKPWEARMLFAGRSRANCYFCFFQRQYELIWLAETHPDLFWRACWIERTTGTEHSQFTWQQGRYLDELLDRRKEIIQRRALEIVKVIASRKQGDLFGFSTDNEIALTSCGLLCGK